MSKFYHDYHLVESSPWPLIASIGAGIITIGTVLIVYSHNLTLIFLGLTVIFLTASQWWRDVRREATYQGHHSNYVQINIRWGIALFIVSEVMFFLSFFWAYFHRRLTPTLEVGITWPPIGISTFNAFGVPLLNTTILLSSGLTVTWAHHRILARRYKNSYLGLLITIILGVYFTIIQGIEYLQAPFSFADSAYGSCFFIATGFHGLHVLIGTTFLLVCFIRLTSGHLSSTHHFGFEAAAWYWHFVDVVWIFLFIRIYWWGG